MLSFLGKIFLFLGAAFSLGALAEKNARTNQPAKRPVEPQGGATPPAAPSMPEPEPEIEPAAGAPAEPPPSDTTPMEAAPPRESGPMTSASASSGKGPAGGALSALQEDPLEAKHRAAAFDRDFRTLDYRHLSQDEVAREKERRRRQHSSWHPKGSDAQEPSPPLQNAQFSHFGGSFVTAEIVRGRSTERVPDLMPSLPGDASLPAEAADQRPLTAPDPRGPTPAPEQRVLLPEDPLAAKHRSGRFDEDFRTLDYGRLDPSRPPASRVDTGSGEAPGPVPDEGGVAPAQAAFRTAGAAAPVPGAEGERPVKTADGDAAALAEDVVAREPERLDATRAGTPDDLTRIDGIGPSLERLLFESGIYHYDQLARWGAGEARWFEAKSGFPGRVARERWVEQAQALIDDRATSRTIL
jgi:predicted flap endonuclease-1-like 5' DNA nuclease